MSYLEIYNEALHDLLSDAPGASSEGLSVIDDVPAGGGGNVSVHRLLVGWVSRGGGVQGRCSTLYKPVRACTLHDFLCK